MTELMPHPDAVPAARPTPAVLAGAVADRPAGPPAESPGALPDAGFDLSLGVEALGERARGIPILGGLAAVFGVAALFKAPLVLGPLGFLFGLAALFRGQLGLAAIGGISGLVALAISPAFWALIGLAWLWSWVWSWF